MHPNNFRRATGKRVALLFNLYTSEMFQLVENRLFAYADDSTLLAVVRKPADTSAVATSLNTELATIQEWYNLWCIILNPNKTKALAVSRYRAVSPRSHFRGPPTSTSLA